MILSKNKKLEKTEKKQIQNNPKKIKTIGRRKTFAVILWSVFILAFAWSVYKNFTAINIHTIEKTEVVETEVVDTSAIESFLSEFINVYYSYDSKNNDGLSERLESLSGFMADDVLQINHNIISGENKISSKVLNCYIWKIEDKGDNYFSVKYTVEQGINKTVITTTTETVTEKVAGKEVKKEVEKPVSNDVYSVVESAYSVVIYVDESDNMVITQNPTVTSVPSKSELYTQKNITTDNSVSVEDKEAITEFLNTFFNQYPTADEITLSYYVENNALNVINVNYEFQGLKSLILQTSDKGIKAYVIVDYIDNSTGLHTFPQYCLTLNKESKWIITGNDLYV